MPVCPHCEKYLLSDGDWDRHVSIQHPHTVEAASAARRIIDEAKGKRKVTFNDFRTPAVSPIRSRRMLDAVVDSTRKATNERPTTAAVLREVLASEMADIAQVRTPQSSVATRPLLMNHVVSRNATLDDLQAAHKQVQQHISAEAHALHEQRVLSDYSVIDRQRDELMMYRERLRDNQTRHALSVTQAAALIADREEKQRKVEEDRKRALQLQQAWDTRREMEQKHTIQHNQAKRRQQESLIEARIADLEPQIRSLLTEGMLRPVDISPTRNHPPTRSSTVPPASKTYSPEIALSGDITSELIWKHRLERSRGTEIGMI
eukprot:TRINITY_DN37190_c0_g1_i1.p1 TRINITY_DN37190_c0_g1~~TRINITY_DN37190_c0_g1_i1.p1  ORF type:complete len:319 (+),score=36.40 TRINITY_DN37190_c0_g1_i1:43-999(+)